MMNGPKIDVKNKSKAELEREKRDIKTTNILLTILVAVLCIALVARIFLISKG